MATCDPIYIMINDNAAQKKYIVKNHKKHTLIKLILRYLKYYLKLFFVLYLYNSYSFLKLQESEGQKTNNGIQYRLQLLYANGE